MAINKKSLQDLFGADDQPKKSIFDDQDDGIEAEDDSQGFTDIDIDDSYEDDLLPAAPVIRNTQAMPISAETVNADFDYSIRTQSSIINNAQQLIQLALQNAVEGGTARDLEVAATAIETAGNAVERLLNLHEKIKKITPADSQQLQPSGNTFIQNQVVYQGTTADIFAKLKEEKSGAIDV